MVYILYICKIESGEIINIDFNMAELCLQKNCRALDSDNTAFVVTLFFWRQIKFFDEMQIPFYDSFTCTNEN